MADNQPIKVSKEAFWSCVNKDGPIPEHMPHLGKCWIWTKAKLSSSKPYGSLRVGGKSCVAHRIAYQLIKGEIPVGHLVCHHCDNPSCVNPEHLFSGTHLTNNHDMISKGRNVAPPIHRGISQHAAILDESCAKEIVRLHKEDGKTRRQISAIMGVGYRCVCDVILGRNWSHVTGIKKYEYIKRSQGSRQQALQSLQ